MDYLLRVRILGVWANQGANTKHEPTFQGGNMSFFKKNNTLWDKELDEATRRLNLSRVMESYKPNEDKGIDVDSVTLSSQSKHLSRLIKLRKRTNIS